MNPARETIQAALFQRLAAIPGFATSSRRLKHWTDVAPAEQPALFQVQKGESRTARTGQPPARRLSVELFIYVTTSADPAAAPAQIMNPLLDAIEAALAPDPGRLTQSLGGLVEHAWIAGRIVSDEGLLGDQAVAIVPIEILIP
ncbi:MAG: hypothetical protein JWO51_2446 [Rhodospirillales bacterium]|nr:hypothetical protein [Rhodospirillales bacterium]